MPSEVAATSASQETDPAPGLRFDLGWWVSVIVIWTTQRGRCFYLLLPSNAHATAGRADVAHPPASGFASTFQRLGGGLCRECRPPTARISCKLSQKRHDFRHADRVRPRSPSRGLCGMPTRDPARLARRTRRKCCPGRAESPPPPP